MRILAEKRQVDVAIYFFTPFFLQHDKITQHDREKVPNKKIRNNPCIYFIHKNNVKRDTSLYQTENYIT